MDTAEHTEENTEIYPNAFAAFLQSAAPGAAETVFPFLQKVLQAWADGHSYIELSGEETAVLQKCAPLAGENHAPLILRGGKLFLGKVFAMEEDCRKRLQKMTAAAAFRQPENLPAEKIRETLDSFFPQDGAFEQKQAAALALLNRFVLISGGPGTGKTTTAAKLLTLLCLGRDPLPQIALTAPTGKAAAHLQQSLLRALATFAIPENIRSHLQNLNGQTLHRLLGIRPPLLEPRYREDAPLPYSIVIADEASMMDLAMMQRLLRALPPNAQLILLGDENQLPALGGGAVLSALARPTVLNPAENAQLTQWLPEHRLPQQDNPPPLSSSVARLTVSHRFGENSGIGQLARAILHTPEKTAEIFAQYPQELVCRPLHNGLFAEHFAKQKDYWRAVAEKDIQAAFRHFYDAVVLCVLRADTANFNRRYSAYLQQKGFTGVSGLFAGLPLMVTQNNPTLDIYNGDIGIVLPDSDSGYRIWFPYADAPRALDIGRLGSYEPAFAMTVHKSQGSEYRHVTLLAPTYEVPELFERSLLYTAVTRAKEHFDYCGSAESFQAAACRHTPRRSALAMFDEIAESFSD